MGAPAAAADIPACREVGGDAALLRLGDPASLADSIAALLDDPHALADLAGAATSAARRPRAANAAVVRESLATATSQAWSAALRDVGPPGRRRRANEDARLGARSDAGRGAEPARVPGQPGVGRRDLCGRLVQSGSHARDRAGGVRTSCSTRSKTTAVEELGARTPCRSPTSGYHRGCRRARDARAALRNRVDGIAPTHDGYFLNRRFIFLGTWIRQRGLVSELEPAAVRHRLGRYDDREVHEHVVLDGSVGYLRHDLLHLDRRGPRGVHCPPQSLLDVGSQGSPEGKPPFSELARLAAERKRSSANASGPTSPPSRSRSSFTCTSSARVFRRPRRPRPVCFTPSRSSWSASSSASYDALASASDEAGASIPTLGPDPRRGRAGLVGAGRRAARPQRVVADQSRHRAHADRGGRQSRATQHCA